MNQATTQAHPLNIETPAAPSLRELLEDGIYLLFLLRDGNSPPSSAEFNRSIDQFLSRFERHAQEFGKEKAMVEHAKYAFCALLDEIVLSSDFPLREDWERMPLQLRLFGEHLAGEGFFDRLEALRIDPPKNIDALEIYYCALLLGFQGKYLLEGQEKLGYLTARLGQEIQHVRGGKAEFAPNWKVPHRAQAYVQYELSLWLYFALLALAGAGIYATFRWLLASQVNQAFGL
ncbi:type VI secretion system protein ImpK [Formivibrio citricus]|uniref:Type VI secretion system protein ImpK n=1 Tax=Formivibrio citricus TaxID=83765 RepID=A0A1I4WUM0_9NEIS|nr:type IVB secretion system protein IcmH/DotU [Formivibrio citricus]SFN16863.1 type VI secretion system protein ImpK [Formivibrio citricus]